jgi:hypothetical protein
MSKLDDYRQRLRELKDWTHFLLKESGLPGPRGNLELAQAVAEQANLQQIETFLSIPSDQAPENSARVFIVFCGVAALGKRAAAGELKELSRLRLYASDSRWRIREAVAIGLQYLGDANMKRLLEEMRRWCKGNWYEQRAAAAALAEPRLLKDGDVVRGVLRILDDITARMEFAADNRSEGFRTLRKTMGYCWSVAIAARPRAGKPFLEKWLKSPSPDIRWLVKENLAKNRLAKMDAVWVQRCKARAAS